MQYSNKRDLMVLSFHFHCLENSPFEMTTKIIFSIQTYQSKLYIDENWSAENKFLLDLICWSIKQSVG